MLVSSTAKLSSLNEICHSVATFNVINSTSICRREATKKHVVKYRGLRNETAEFDMIYLLTAIGLSPGGSTHLHTNNT